jgi:cation transport ATPase
LDLAQQAVAALYALSIAAGGWTLFRGAARSLRTFSLDMNVLMSAAVVGASFWVIGPKRLPSWCYMPYQNTWKN